MKTRVTAAQIIYLQLLNRLDHIGRNQKHILINARQVLQGLDKQGRAGAQQFTGLAGDDGAVGSSMAAAV